MQFHRRLLSPIALHFFRDSEKALPPTTSVLNTHQAPSICIGGSLCYKGTTASLDVLMNSSPFDLVQSSKDCATHSAVDNPNISSLVTFLPLSIMWIKQPPPSSRSSKILVSIRTTFNPILENFHLYLTTTAELKRWWSITGKINQRLGIGDIQRYFLTRSIVVFLTHPPITKVPLSFLGKILQDSKLVIHFIKIVEVQIDSVLIMTYELLAGGCAPLGLVGTFSWTPGANKDTNDNEVLFVGSRFPPFKKSQEFSCDLI